MRTLKVAFELHDPIGTDSDGNVLTIESPESEVQKARIRTHLHALNTQPRYKRWIFKNLSKRDRRIHERAAAKFKEFLSLQTVSEGKERERRD